MKALTISRLKAPAADAFPRADEQSAGKAAQFRLDARIRFERAAVAEVVLQQPS